MLRRWGPALAIAVALATAGCAPAQTPAGARTTSGTTTSSGVSAASGVSRASGSPAASATPAAAVSGATSTPYPAATPVGFVLPTTCSYIGAPIAGAESRAWYVDCHAASVADVNGPLVAAFTQQGWTACGTGPLRALWAKGSIVLTVMNSPGGDTLVSESARAPGQCP
ncbi:MAG: hypothetical protein ABR525_09755 [Candidatus Limnocylindria bacterium]